MKNIIRVQPDGDDSFTITYVEVYGEDGVGPEQAVTGWVSAMTNFFPADQYGEDGHLRPDSVSRSMTMDEVHEYWSELVEAADPPALAPLFDAGEADSAPIPVS